MTVQAHDRFTLVVSAEITIATPAASDPTLGMGILTLDLGTQATFEFDVLTDIQRFDEDTRDQAGH